MFKTPYRSNIYINEIEKSMVSYKFGKYSNIIGHLYDQVVTKQPIIYYFIYRFCRNREVEVKDRTKRGGVGRCLRHTPRLATGIIYYSSSRLCGGYFSLICLISASRVCAAVVYQRCSKVITKYQDEKYRRNSQHCSSVHTVFLAIETLVYVVVVSIAITQRLI